MKKLNYRSIMVVTLILVMMSTVLTGCASQRDASTTAPAQQTVTDQAGRQVTIPATINKVYYTSPIGQIMVYVLAPDKMAGWTMQLSDNEKKYILPQYRDLPYLGGMQMNAKINTEELVKAGPNLILNVGSDPATADTISTSDKLQEQTNIPVVFVNGSLENTEQALTFIGELLGAQDRTKEIIAYCNKTLDETTKATKDIPADKRVRVYYAEGPKGLATEPSGSAHAKLLDILNITNVAKVEKAGQSGMSNCSLEQVLSWNPDVILAWGTDRGGAYDLILSSPDWKNINAVKNKKVYEIPNYPFNWFDRPPSISRFLGLKWLAATLYPDQYKVDMVEETKGFYKLFYHIDITDADARALLKTSIHS
ncbi:MAG: ABC transporter substrate-binding protein [Syntrophomonadaceae bacterium]|nr:ABC transporter substrate-binding protein [Syntrophomonadaceae bacterium]